MELYPSQYIHATCTIIERFAPTAFRAQLSNGKILVAFIQKREEALLDILQPGDLVRVTITPADFERARIRERLEQDASPTSPPRRP